MNAKGKRKSRNTAMGGKTIPPETRCPAFRLPSQAGREVSMPRAEGGDNKKSRRPVRSGGLTAHAEKLGQSGFRQFHQSREVGLLAYGEIGQHLAVDDHAACCRPWMKRE